MICDEVTSALDADLRQTVVALLERLRSERGIAFLFVTHDLSTAAGFADRLLVMRDGRLVEGGATVEVLSQPREPYTKTLIRSVPSPDPGWLDRILATRWHGGSARCQRAGSGGEDRHPRMTLERIWNRDRRA